MKKLLALVCVSVLMLAPACCRRGPCGEPCGVEECDVIDTLRGTEQCVNICAPDIECREECPPSVVCTTKKVPVQWFRNQKTCVVTNVSPAFATCEDESVEKCAEDCAMSCMGEPMVGGAELGPRKPMAGVKKMKREMREKTEKAPRKMMRKKTTTQTVEGAAAEAA